MNKEIPEKTVNHCPTEKLAKKVIEFFNNYGIIWKGCNQWDKHRDLTCYHPYVAEKRLEYSGLDFYIREGLQIIEAEEFLKKYNMEKKEIKVEVPEGMEVDLEKSIMNEHEVSIVYKAIKKDISYDDISNSIGIGKIK